MLRLLYIIVKDFGTLGAVIGLGCTNIWFVWKIGSNHLKHIADDLKVITEKVDNVGKEISPIKERISKIEGILQ